MNTDNAPIDLVSAALVDPLWVLKDAIEFARLFESIIDPSGYHCAIGGGVLHNGQSDKDLDIFVYPHYKQSPVDSFEPVLDAIQALPMQVKRVEFYKDTKIVFMGDWNGKRIDFFFLS